MAAVTAAVLGGISLAATVHGQLEARQAGKKAARQQREANEISKASAQAENARKRRRAIAQARIAQAQNIASQGGQVQSSSATTGAQTGIASTLGANLSSQRRGLVSGQSVFDLNQAASDTLRQGQETQALFGAIGQAAGTAASFAGSFGQPSAEAGPSFDPTAKTKPAFTSPAVGTPKL